MGQGDSGGAFDVQGVGLSFSIFGLRALAFDNPAAGCERAAALDDASSPHLVVSILNPKP